MYLGALHAKAPQTFKEYACADRWISSDDVRAVLLCRAAGVPGSHMAGHIVLTGRAKDTIVLASGENVEPAPIEDALACSPFIANVVLVGQDARMLGALVVPSAEAFQELEAVRGGAAMLLSLC